MATLIVAAILLVDQFIKIWVKTHMTIGEDIKIADWFYISFVENNGMAYGITFINKLVLSLLRIVAVCLIGVYIHHTARRKASWGYIACLSMVLAGAAGNIFDSMFYGLCFSESHTLADDVHLADRRPGAQQRAVDLIGKFGNND